MKHIFITGSTDGIGKLAALKLAVQGHHLYVHGRSPEKVKATVEDLKQKAKTDLVKGFVADLSDLSAISKLAAEIKTEGLQLDVLINNAGVFFTKSPISAQGLDLRFVVNYLSPYLLTQELLPVLLKSKSPRLINLSSAAQAPVDLAALKGERSLGDQGAYAQSKLALTMWSHHLALNEPGLNVIAVNPGSLLNTKMVQEAYGQFWSSADKGADILCALATSAEYDGSSGKYFDNDKGRFGQAHPDTYDAAKTKALLEVTTQILDQ